MRRLMLLVGAVLAAAVALLGLGALGESLLGGDSAVSEPDAAATIDKLVRAATVGDGAAIGDLYTTDAVYRTAHGQKFVGRKAIVAIEMAPSALRLTLRRVAPVTTHADLATTFVRYSGSMSGIKLSVYEFKRGKIVRHWDFEAGLTPPLDNAVQP